MFLLPKRRRELIIDALIRAEKHVENEMSFIERVRDLFKEGGDNYKGYVELAENIMIMSEQVREFIEAMLEHV